MRLDQYLVSKGFFSSREKAINAIKDNAISVNGKIINKPSYDCDDVEIEVLKETNKYVSRGGLKLEKAISYFNLDFTNKTVLDIGASTGGFTDCSLKHGAKLVHSVDVGSNQLVDELKYNDKVISVENTNIMDYVTQEVFDYLVMDVSFVSIKYIFPELVKFLNDDNTLIALIKPQYEIGKVKVKNGIVKDLKMHTKIIEDIIGFIEAVGYNVIDLTVSPIKGKTGNTEYLICVQKNKPKKSFIVRHIVEKSN